MKGTDRYFAKNREAAVAAGKKGYQKTLAGRSPEKVREDARKGAAAAKSPKWAREEK